MKTDEMYDRKWTMTMHNKKDKKKYVYMFPH